MREGKSECTALRTPRGTHGGTAGGRALHQPKNVVERVSQIHDALRRLQGLNVITAALCDDRGPEKLFQNNHSGTATCRAPTEALYKPPTLAVLSHGRVPDPLSTMFARDTVHCKREHSKQVAVPATMPRLCCKNTQLERFQKLHAMAVNKIHFESGHQNSTGSPRCFMPWRSQQTKLQPSQQTCPAGRRTALLVQDIALARLCSACPPALIVEASRLCYNEGI